MYYFIQQWVMNQYTNLTKQQQLRVINIITLDTGYTLEGKILIYRLCGGFD
jgi:hypothetical protein